MIVGEIYSQRLVESGGAQRLRGREAGGAVDLNDKARSGETAESMSGATAQSQAYRIVADDDRFHARDFAESTIAEAHRARERQAVHAIAARKPREAGIGH